MTYLMGNKFRFIFFLLLASICSFVSGQERKPVPDYRGHVNDFANLLSEDERRNLEGQLLAYEDSTSTQIAVIIEQNLNGRDVYDRAMDFARGWGVGQKDKRNGVVLYFALDDRLIAIATADKTQGALGDGETGSIIRNVIRPEFRKGNYYLGISNAINAIAEALEGEFEADEEKEGKPRVSWVLIVFIILAVIISLIRRGGGGRNGGFGRGGGYFLPGMLLGGGRGSSGGGGGWGGFGGGGGFNGGGATGSW